MTASSRWWRSLAARVWKVVPASEARSPDEKVWPRARREFNARLHGPAFWVLETVGAAIFGLIVGNRAATVIWLAAVLVLFSAWAVLTTPVIQRDEARADLTAHVVSAPRLSFGPVELPTSKVPIQVTSEGGATRDCGYGGIVRVPVANAHGAADARRVHAVLRFMPTESQDGTLWPSRTQAEWLGSTESEIDMPGNGASHLLNIAVVLEGGYPPVREWTPRSRAAALRGYEVWARPVDIEVTVAGANVGPLTDTVRLDVTDSAADIFAQWLNGVGPEEQVMATWANS